MDSPLYVVRLMFEWGGGILWPGNAAARARFDVGPCESRLPLTAATRERLDQLSAWHDTALDWNDPAGPGPWTVEEEARFEAAAADALEAVRAELGPAYHVVYVRL